MLTTPSEKLVEQMLLSEDPLLRIFGEAWALQWSKSQDYNSVIKRDDYWIFGLKSFAQMILIKAYRLVSLSEQKPNNESVADTGLDLINYSAFMVEWTRRQK